MNKLETVKILAIIKAAYTKFFISENKDDVQIQVETWHSLFSEEPYRLVEEAVKALMCTLKFPPTVADVKEKITLILKPQMLSEMEAWHIVKKAVDDYDYYETPDYNRAVINRLPPAIKRIVGSVNQLREWQEMDRGVFNSVIQSNIMRSYSAIVRHEAECSALPASTKVLMLEIEGARQKRLEARG